MARSGLHHPPLQADPPSVLLGPPPSCPPKPSHWLNLVSAGLFIGIICCHLWADICGVPNFSMQTSYVCNCIGPMQATCVNPRVQQDHTLSYRCPRYWWLHCHCSHRCSTSLVMLLHWPTIGSCFNLCTFPLPYRLPEWNQYVS